MNKEARNEQRKLIATFCNNVGTGIISAGVLTPIVALVLGLASTSLNVTTVSTILGVASFVGLGFHAIGRLFLIGYEA